MKLGFIIKTAFKNIFRQKFIAFASILIMILTFFLLNIFIVVGGFSYKYSKYLEQQNFVVLVFFNNDCAENAAPVQSLREDVAKLNLDKTIEYRSSQEVFDKWFDIYFKDDENIRNSKPATACSLGSELRITPLSIESARQLVEWLKVRDATKQYPIKRISFSRDIAIAWQDILSKVQIGTGIAIIFLGLIVFMVTSLLIEASLRSRADEIGIMQLVGARNSSVGTIFVFEGIIYGCIGAIIVAVIFVILYTYLYYARDSVPLIASIFELSKEIELPELSILNLAAFFFIEVICGMLLGAIYNWFSVRRYL